MDFVSADGQIRPQREHALLFSFSSYPAPLVLVSCGGCSPGPGCALPRGIAPFDAKNARSAVAYASRPGSFFWMASSTFRRQKRATSLSASSVKAFRARICFSRMMYMAFTDVSECRHAQQRLDGHLRAAVSLLACCVGLAEEALVVSVDGVGDQGIRAAVGDAGREGLRRALVPRDHHRAGQRPARQRNATAGTVGGKGADALLRDAGQRRHDARQAAVYESHDRRATHTQRGMCCACVN